MSFFTPTIILSLISLFCFNISAMANETHNSGSLQRISKVGFEKAGHWRIEQNRLSYTLGKHKKAKNILYAFVAQNKIKYIGKTTKTFKQRMYQYKKPGPTQMTNIRNHNHICALLNNNIPVQIYVFIDDKPKDYEGFRINLAAGLEDSLINKLSPPWNGKKLKNKTVATCNNPTQK